MKSHVREQWAKQIVNQSMRRITKDGYDEIEFSPMIKEIINSTAPDINFTDWIITDKNVWKVKAELLDTKEVIEVSGRGINECMNSAKEHFGIPLFKK